MLLDLHQKHFKGTLLISSKKDRVQVKQVDVQHRRQSKRTQPPGDRSACRRGDKEQQHLNTARDAFLERFKIRAWDNTGNWRDGELAYKTVGGFFFGGTKEYYVRQQGGWNKGLKCMVL